MTRTSRYVRLALPLLAASAVVAPASAHAQTADRSGGEWTANDAVGLGDWTLRPSMQVRSRIEARRAPFDTGGFTTAGADAPAGTVLTWAPTIKNQWFLHNRARVGLSAHRGYLAAVVQLQDVRAWGEAPLMAPDGRDRLVNTSAHLAFVEVHSSGTTPSFLRIGRQELQWGEGRLVGRSDWAPTGRSLDAARGMWTVGNFDLDAFASILSTSGGLSPELARGATPATKVEGSGTQLYGLRGAWHISPLLHVEINSLARIARQPLPIDGRLIPSSLYVAGARFSGRFFALDYGVEGVYELGRIAGNGSMDTIRAYAGAARLEVDTGWIAKLRLGTQAAFASGQKTGSRNVTRFDPILPDVHAVHGPMGLYAWSNVIEGAGFVHLTPVRDSQVIVGYRHVALAEPSDQWQSSSLALIGQNSSNRSRTLGNEADITMAWSPFAPLSLALGYGAFFTGAGAKAILQNQGRGRPGLQHFGYAQATVIVP